MNCGHDRETAFVVRVEGDAREPRMFNTFGLKVVAAIGNLPTTVEDRAIKINLTRKPVFGREGQRLRPQGRRTSHRSDPLQSRSCGR